MVPLLAVRRLLRSLHDAEELRKNPLAARYFADAERAAGSRSLYERTIVARIRAAVVSAIDSLDPRAGGGRARGARQSAILRRCDLQGEKHETVARALDISRREFYRERRRAFERLALALAREFSTPVEPARIRPTELELGLQYASSLHLVGRFDAALDEIDVRTAGEPTSPERTRALCYGVEIACDAGDPQRARDLLRKARESLEGAHEPEGIALSRARISIAEGIVAWRTGEIEHALHAYQSAAESLRIGLAPNDQSALEALATALLRTADVLSESGKGDEALAVLGEARSIEDRMPHQVPLLRADISSALGSAHAVMAGGLSLAIDELQEAFATYQRHHAIRRAAKTLIELSVLFMQRENYEESLRYGRTALAVASSVCGPTSLRTCV